MHPSKVYVKRRVGRIEVLEREFELGPKLGAAGTRAGLQVIVQAQAWLIPPPPEAESECK